MPASQSDAGRGWRNLVFYVCTSERGKRTICAKYHSHTLTGWFMQDDSRNNGDDSRADVADSHKQAIKLSNIFLSYWDYNYLIYQLAMWALFVDFLNLYIMRGGGDIYIYNFHCVASVCWNQLLLNNFQVITVKLTLFIVNLFFCYVVGAIPPELVSILPHAGSQHNFNCNAFYYSILTIKRWNILSLTSDDPCNIDHSRISLDVLHNCVNHT